jgi:hypothetical protein
MTQEQPDSLLKKRQKGAMPSEAGHLQVAACLFYSEAGTREEVRHLVRKASRAFSMRVA